MNHILADKMGKSDGNSGYQVAVVSKEASGIKLLRFKFYFCHILDVRL